MCSNSRAPVRCVISIKYFLSYPAAVKCPLDAMYESQGAKPTRLCKANHEKFSSANFYYLGQSSVIFGGMRFLVLVIFERKAAKSSFV